MQTNALIFFDDDFRGDLLPLTFTRPSSELRVGILTVKEKWEHELKIPSSGNITQKYLSEKFPCSNTQDTLFINGSVLPNLETLQSIQSLHANETLFSDGIPIAAKISGEFSPSVNFSKALESNLAITASHAISKLRFGWDIFSKNGEELLADFERVTKNRTSENLSNTCTVIGNGPIFIEAGVKAEAAIFNTETGPIYLGKNVQIMEGSLIRGPFAACENSVCKLGAKIYGPTTLGPGSKVGGELNNVVIQANSNKGHDGFLGNAVLGEWCNLGADTNNSNLKNNYSTVSMYNYREKREISTGLQFSGLIMGDHSKCGINTMFNTGTVVGVFANIFGAGFPAKFIPSFAWGGVDYIKDYKPGVAFKVAEKVMKRRDIDLTEADKKILEEIHKQTAKFRESQ